jgi:hypothetical protein
VQIMSSGFEKTTILRNFDAKATMTAHRLVEGNIYRVYKMQVKEGESFDTCSVAWVYLDDGTAVEVLNAHILLEVEV